MEENNKQNVNDSTKEDIAAEGQLALVEENKMLQKQIKELEDTVLGLQLDLNNVTKESAKKITDLENLLIDKEFESGIFVEKDIFNKLDQENMKLRTLLETFYKTELQSWYSEVKNEVAKMSEIDKTI